MKKFNPAVNLKNAVAWEPYGSVNVLFIRKMKMIKTRYSLNQVWVQLKVNANTSS